MSPAGRGDRRPALGRRAEDLAAATLEAAGMTVLARNWVCVFCEVRSRTGEASGDPLESVTLHKQAQVIRTARLYLSEAEPIAVSGYRFDVVAVTFFTDQTEPRVVHIAGAFET